jgi:hypothetical protein
MKRPNLGSIDQPLFNNHVREAIGNLIDLSNCRELLQYLNRHTELPFRRRDNMSDLG